MVSVRDGSATFSFFRPGANHVCLVGEFNAWQPGQMPMTRRADGYWHISVRLPSGSFKFRYWVDGRWFTDFAAFGIEYGPYGPDSVVRIPPAMTRKVEGVEMALGELTMEKWKAESSESARKPRVVSRKKNASSIAASQESVNVR